MNQLSYQWAVLGAGPAGIAAVGKLLDQGIPAPHILWVDPQFKVGDFGQLWANVSSNTKVKFFTKFLLAVKAFDYEAQAGQFALSQLDPEETCTLRYMVDPLQWITDKLLQQVPSLRSHITSISLADRQWHLRDGETTYKAKNVILATGASPTQLNYSGKTVIPFNTAIDKGLLAAAVTASDTIAVFGSSHSAIMILRYLVDLGTKQIINFYRSPTKYAVDMGDWILFDNTGLKGQTAHWSREFIDGVNPSNLKRYYASDANIAEHLPACDKVIYAVGFDKRNSVLIDGFEDIEHNPYIGLIAPGLFGLGIAYPELKTDPFGSTESQVGLWKFMNYLNRVLPVWLNYSA